MISLGVEGAFDCQSAALEDVSIDHGGLYVLVTKQFLNGADVIAMLKKMSGKGMAEGMGRNMLVQFCKADGLFDGALKNTFVEVVAHDFPGFRIDRTLVGGEDVLPARFAIGIGVFSFERVRKVNFAIPFLKVLLVKGFHPLNVHPEVEENAFRKRNGAVVLPFCIAHNDLMTGNVNILDAQSKAFHEPQAGAEEELHHESGDAVHPRDHRHGFGSGKDRRKPFWFFGADDVGGEIELPLEHVPVKEEDGAESLVLGGSGDVPLGGKVDDERLDFGNTHLGGVALFVVEDIAFAPVDVGLFGAIGIVFCPDGIAELVE